MLDATLRAADTGRAMLEKNMQVALELVDAVNRGDADAFLACLSPDVECEENGDIPGVGVVYRGREEVRAWFEEVLVEPWESIAVRVEEIREAPGGRVFSGLTFSTRGRGSGVEAEIRFWTASWFVDAKVARRQVFWTRDEALEALGLRDQA
jgi:ketosteroid isomerase-like protein